MEYEVQCLEVAARPLAAARGASTRAGLGPTIIRLLDKVWPVLREQRVHTGHNVVMYLDDLSNIVAGVEVFDDFRATPDVHPSATPVGLVATTTHWGEYSEMAGAYAALKDWCATNGHQLAGPSWEVYGDWHDDPAQRRTDIFHLLRVT